MGRRMKDISDALALLESGMTQQETADAVPLAKGGTHSWGNVRVAHRICNSIKNDAMPPQSPPPGRQARPRALRPYSADPLFPQ